jgi:hypothetical protein
MYQQLLRSGKLRKHQNEDTLWSKEVGPKELDENTIFDKIAFFRCRQQWLKQNLSSSTHNYFASLLDIV